MVEKWTIEYAYMVVYNTVKVKYTNMNNALSSIIVVLLLSCPISNDTIGVIDPFALFSFIET